VRLSAHGHRVLDPSPSEVRRLEAAPLMVMGQAEFAGLAEMLAASMRRYLTAVDRLERSGVDLALAKARLREAQRDVQSGGSPVSARGGTARKEREARRGE
jgi:hypothetical protein